MIPVYQTQFVAEVSERAGNCLAACVASVLEIPLEDVPNFAAIPGETEWWDALQSFLRERGLYALPVVCPFEAEGLYLAYGKSPRGEFQHVVVYRDGDLVHDPHPDGTGLDGEPSLLWLFVANDPAKYDARAS